MSQQKIRTIILITTLVLVAIIPTASFILSKNFRTSSSASSGVPNYAKTVTKPKTASASAKPAFTDLSAEATASAQPTPSPTPEITFGPTLTFNVQLQGRPTNRQATKMFVGIAVGQPTVNPSYLLSFTVDVPDSGLYKGLSLAGLTVGSTYTAYLKGTTQLATASAFLMQGNETVLNNGTPLNLITGDLNQDNIINSADITIFKAAFGSTPTYPNWNANADFNLDGVITALDYAIMASNINPATGSSSAGNSGTWISTPATGSAVMVPPSVGGPETEATPSSGYWMWVPK